MSWGTLFVVATPIGNLQDITLRALEILKSVNVIACEDTRTSGVLLRHWGINAKLLSLHKFSERSKTEAIIERLNAGEDVALISDAGTPAVSDPGAIVVAAAAEAGVTVSPIPGSSSIMAALSVSGFDCSTFVYLGFVPKKTGEREAFFHSLVSETKTAVFFETPVRLLASLKMAARVLPERDMALCRELTKLHEEILHKKAGELHDLFAVRDKVRGEIVLVVKGADLRANVLDLPELVSQLMSEGFSGKALAQEAKDRFGAPKTQAYDTYLKLSHRKA